MPRYDYRCVICGGVQELERSIHEEADNPVCCNQIMGRLYNTVPIQFNGSGFYTTDNPGR